MKRNFETIFFLLFSIVRTAISLDCRGLTTLSSYLRTRGGSFNSAECISIVIDDPRDPLILNSPSCDALVVDSTDKTYDLLLSTAGVTCPVLSTSILTVFQLNRHGIGGTLGSIYCVESSNPLDKLYHGVLDKCRNSHIDTVILPVIPSDTGDLSSRVSFASIQIRDWIRKAYGDNNMRCPFKIIVPSGDTSSYNTILNGFSKAFSINVTAYEMSLKGAPPSRPPPPVPRPTPRPIPIPAPRSQPTQPLRDFNQYDGIACPTMKNLFDQLTESNDPYLSKYTSVTTQISLSYSSFNFGIFSCDMIVLETGSDIFRSIMSEMRLSYSSHSNQESGVVIRSPVFVQNSHEWFSSIQKVVYMSLEEAIREVSTFESLLSLIKEAYMNIFNYANRHGLTEILILPFGFWSRRHSDSIQTVSAAVDGLAEALNEFLLSNNQVHVTILLESREKLDVFTSQIKPHFMSVRASDELLGGVPTGTDIPRPKPLLRPIPHSRPLPERFPPPRPHPPYSGPVTVVPGSRTQFVFNSDEDCMSGTPVSEFIQTMFNGRIQQPSTANHFSLILTNNIPGVLGCGCLVVDASDNEQLELALRLGVDRKECTSVGSSELKVISTGPPNPYTMQHWMADVTRVFCVDTSRFLYNTRVKSLETLYRKILSSAKYRCRTILTPLLATSMTTSESRNKEYILQAVQSMDEFFSTSSQRNSLHLTFYESASEKFFLALELLATYYLEYTSVGGLRATIRTINQNWMSLNEMYGAYIAPSFRSPTVRPKKKGIISSFKKEITRLASRSTTPRVTRPRTPPPRPPLPKLAGDKRFVQTGSEEGKGEVSYIYPSVREFSKFHSKSSCKSLYTLHYWIGQLVGFVSNALREESKNFYFVNHGTTPPLKDCDSVALDTHHSNIQMAVESYGHRLVMMDHNFHVLPGDHRSSRSARTKVILVNPVSSRDTSVYKDIILSAASTAEKQVAIPILGLLDSYSISRNHAVSHVKKVLRVILDETKQLNLKVIIYEEDPDISLILFEILINIFSGRTIF
ncbi:hypothetical protein HWI79_1589 [Cryptosporidium felis]|nr:hypothetical protein HWI79_1589 [Cryptosporidium felis]